MATIVTRSGKGSPLTNNEVDANFTNLNTDKAELSGATFTGAITANAGVVVDQLTIDGGNISSSSGGMTISGADDITLDAVGDVILSCDGDQVKFDDGTSTRFTFNLDSTPTMGMGTLTLFENEIDVATGNLTLDVAGNINLDADGANVYFNDGGTERYRFKLDATPEINVTGGTFTFKNNTSDADILFSGNDGGSAITALTLDMSDAGTALFNNHVSISDDSQLRFGAGNDATISHNSSNNNFQITNSNTSGGMVIQNNGSVGGIALQPVINENAVFCSPNAQVILYHNGVAKFETTSGGIEVTGDITNDSGDLTLDVAGDIILNADGGEVLLQDGSVTYGQLKGSTSDFIIQSLVSDKDIIFKGLDGAAIVSALTLDMSAAGAATFNSTISSGKVAITGATATGEQAHTTFTNTQGAKTYAIGGGQSGVTNNGFVIRNVTDNTFPLVISDAGAATFNGDVSVPNISVADDIRHTGDSDTYISFEANNQTYYSGGTRALDLASGSAVFNEGGGDVDFRVESDTNTNMLFVDGGNNRVGIGTGSPSEPLHVQEGSSGITSRAGTIALIDGSGNTKLTIASGATSTGELLFGRSTDNDAGRIIYDHNDNSLSFYTSSSERFRIASDGAATFTGTVTANAGVVIDNITIDGSEIDSSSSLLLDIAGNLTINVDGSTVSLNDDTINFGQFYQNASGNFNIYSPTSNKDMLFVGNDGGSTITALTLDMSQSGRATFNEGIVAKTSAAGDFGLNLNTYAGDSMKLQVVDTGTAGAAHGSIKVSDGNLTLDVAGDIILDADGADVILKDGGTGFLEIDKDGDNARLKNPIADGDIKIQGIDGASTITALTLDMSNAGAATFNAGATIQTATNEEDALLIKQSDGTDVGSLRINNGSFLLKGKSASQPVQIQSHDGNEDIEIDPDGFIKFETAGSEKMRIESDGAVVLKPNGITTGLRLQGRSSDNNFFIQWNSNDGGTNYGSIGSVSATPGLQYSADDHKFVNQATNSAFMQMNSSGTVFNEDSQDRDFRVESNDNTHMLFVDGGNNRVGIGKAPASNQFEVGVFAQFDSGAVFNEGSNDSDFRVESNGNTHALFVDGGTSKVGINKSAPDRALHVNADSASDIATFQNNSGSYTFGKTANLGSLDLASDASFRIRHGSTESVRFGPSATIFNEGSADVDFRVESDGNANLFNIDGGTDEVRIGTNAGIQSIAHLGVRQNGSAIEFGHENNGGGYYGTLGAFGSSGRPYIGFSTFCEASANTFTTTGQKGSLIFGDGSGNLSFAQVPTASATGQSPVTYMTLTDAGALTLGSSTNTSTLARLDHENSGGKAELQLNSHGSASFSMLSNFTGSTVTGVATGNFGLVTPHNAAISIVTSGIERIKAESAGNVVINESGADADFRVESNNDSSALFVDGADGTTTVRKLNLGVGGGLRGEGAISVGTSATNITSANDFGALCIVSGNSGGNIFTDLVFFATTMGATVVTGGTVSGGPAGRTYSVVSSKLKLAMASGTYSVKATAFMGTL